MPLTPLVHKLGAFTPLSREDRSALQACVTRVVEFAPGEELIAEREKPTAVHLMLRGWAARFKTLPDGNRYNMAVLIPGDLCDIQVTLLDCMDHSIDALSPCTVAKLSRERVTELLHAGGNLSRALWWSTLVDEAILREWLVTKSGRDALGQVAHLICELLMRSWMAGVSDGQRFSLPLSQVQLAETTGLTNVHMNRMLQALRRSGLIAFEAQRMEVLDWPALQKVASFDAVYLHRATFQKALGIGPSSCPDQ